MNDPLSNPGELIKRVYAYAAYRVGDGAEAEDIASETFERAMRYRDSFDPRRGDAASWLIGIARRCIADRALRPEPELAFAGVIESHEVGSLQTIELAAAVATLKERDREIIALRFGADLSAREIAQLLELRTNTVEVALHRALARLRCELEPEPPRQAAISASPRDAPSS